MFKIVNEYTRWIERPHHIKHKYLLSISIFIIAVIISLYNKEYKHNDLYVVYLNTVGFFILTWYNLHIQFREGTLIALFGFITCLSYLIYVQYKLNKKKITLNK